MVFVMTRFLTELEGHIHRNARYGGAPRPACTQRVSALYVGLIRERLALKR